MNPDEILEKNLLNRFYIRFVPFQSCVFLCIVCSTDMDSEAEEIEDDVGPADKDICCVFDKVAAYMQTAQDTTVHMVPKAIMHHIVRKMEKFINTELLVQILKDVDTNEVGFPPVFDSFTHLL